MAAAVLFLLASDVLGHWNGHAVSVRPSAGDPPRAYRVLVVEPGGRTLERTWAAEVVEPLGLPMDPLALAPPELPETAAQTSKSRFALHMFVRGSTDTTSRIVPTTSPSALGLALLVGVLVVFLRNMAVAGSPFAIEPTGVWLPPALARPGAPATPAGRATPRKGPPPARPRTGRGRR